MSPTNQQQRAYRVERSFAPFAGKEWIRDVQRQRHQARKQQQPTSRQQLLHARTVQRKMTSRQQQGKD